MSGIEVVGLVLGVLPLCIHAWEWQSKSRFSFLQKALLRSHKKEAIAKFFQEFHWRTNELSRVLSNVLVENLNLPGNIRRTLKAGDVDSWVRNPDVRQALLEFFGSRELLDVVLERLSLISQLFIQLLDDETLQLEISVVDKDKIRQLHLCTEEAFLKNIETHKKKKNSKTDDGGYKARARFFKREKDREIALEKLKLWTKHIDHIVTTQMNMHTNKAAKASLAATSGATGASNIFNQDSIASYSPQLKDTKHLSRRLLTLLSEFWRCGSSIQHEAKLCLKDCVLTDQSLRDRSISFDFLVHIDVTNSSLCHNYGGWFDGTATMFKAAPHNRSSTASTCTSSGPLSTQTRAKGICKALQDLQCTQQFGLDLTIHEPTPGGTQPQISQHRRHRKHDRTQHLEISFDSCLQPGTLNCRPSILERRSLALTFAYSLFQFHDAPWLHGEHWSKQNIHFLQTDSTGRPDIGAPYLVTSFGSHTGQSGAGNVAHLHKDESLLKLGVLMLEIQLWRRIEEFRTPEDLLNGEVTPLTDINVAARVMSQWQDVDDTLLFYEELVNNCFDQPWLKHSFVNTKPLDEAEVWRGVFEFVIAPLEAEVRYMKGRSQRQAQIGQVALRPSASLVSCW